MFDGDWSLFDDLKPKHLFSCYYRCGFESGSLVEVIEHESEKHD